MEWNPQTLLNLSQTLIDALSPIPELRRSGESKLSDAADDIPRYGLALLRLLAEQFVDNPAVDEVIREAAAVHIKNYIKSRWWAPLSSSSLPPIPDSEKEEIKALIVPLMLSSSITRTIQSQLIEAISVILGIGIEKHDEYLLLKFWPGLLSHLRTGLEKATINSDYGSFHVILGTINSLLNKLRSFSSHRLLYMNLKYGVNKFAEPLRQNFEFTAALIDTVVLNSDDGHGQAASTLKSLIDSQRLCCEIFYSLTFFGVTEIFVRNLDMWMSEFKKYVMLKYSDLEDGGSDGVELVDGLRVAVCEILSRFIEENRFSLFQKYFSGFVETIWSLLVVASQSSNRDRLTMSAIKFITSMSRSYFFHTDDNLQQVCQTIMPNVMLRDEDQELFEANYVEFIQRDMEGNRVYTRRIACEVLKEIASKSTYKEKVFKKVSSQIQSCLAMFAQNSAANWKHKECAIFLVVSFATEKGGGSSVSTTDLVDENFFESVVLSELQSQDVNEFPMLKAGALKFFTKLRNQISKSIALTLLPDVVRFINSESNVVHSYAAICVEKLLLVKDDGARAVYTPADIDPYLLELMGNLLNALKKPESEENQYVMKCIMQALGVADISAEVASPCISELTSVLNRVCKNPRNTFFNHYLLVALTVLIRQACEKNPFLVSTFEECLLHSLEIILANNVTELFPYAFQLLAQLVKLNRPLILPNYMQIFRIILLPDFWDEPANVPGLVHLLKSFLQNAPHELNGKYGLNQVIDILKKLVTSSSTDDQGFYVLNTIIEILGYDLIAPYMKHIWTFLLWGLENNRPVMSPKSLVIFMSLFLVKHGPQNLVDSVSALLPGTFTLIIEQIWIPNLKLMAGSTEIKLALVASSRLICESPVLLDKTTVRLWGMMLDSIVTLLPGLEQDRLEEEPEVEQDRVEQESEVSDFGEIVGYNASWEKEEDLLNEIKDPKQYLLTSLENFFRLSPGRYPYLISKNLQANLAALLPQFCSSYH